MKERVVEHVCAALCNLSFENDALRIQLGQLGACAFEYAPHTHTFSLSLSLSLCLSACLPACVCTYPLMLTCSRLIRITLRVCRLSLLLFLSLRLVCLHVCVCVCVCVCVVYVV
jgi:hypothetical protein